MPTQNCLTHPKFRTLPPVEREVLFRQHKRQSWVDIADEMGVSERQAQQICERALAKLQEMPVKVSSGGKR